ncbi:MAG: outer membrane beta-barrel family protein [Prevotella sp.]|nr:outer membrane beta-barrel family protein [Prevotella sp.]
MSFTRNRQNSDIYNAAIASLYPASEDLLKQMMWAMFFAHNVTMGDFTIDLGGRYEHAKFDYYEDGTYRPGQSRKFGDFFPYVQVSYDKDFSASLSFSRFIQHPDYSALSNNVEYIDAYTYQGGNPSLVAAYESKLSALLSYKDLSFDASLAWHDSPIEFVYRPARMPHAIMAMTENIGSYKDIDLNLSYSPTFGCWSPTFSVGLIKQWMRYGGVGYNRPYFNYGMNNIVKFGKHLTFTFNVYGTSAGDARLTHFRPMFGSTASLGGWFLKNRLYASAMFNNVFNNHTESWERTANGIYMSKDSKSWHGFMLSFTYYLNPYRSKFKGGASSSEMGRFGRKNGF